MSSGTITTAGPKIKTFTIDLAKSAGTYDVTTATGDNVFIKNITFHVTVAGVGLTSVTVQTNMTTPITVLASVVVASITIDKNLTPFTTVMLLPSTKKIQYTVVGTGSAGTILATVEYYSANGDLA